MNNRPEVSSKSYHIKDAIEVLRSFENMRKFKQAVELMIVLKDSKKKKANTNTGKFVFNLSHGLPQDLKILAVVSSTMEKQLKQENTFPNLHIAGEEAIDKIVREGKTDYDMVVCTTEMFTKFTKHAKLLGQLRIMPSSKTGTVLDNVMLGVKDLLLGTKLKVKKHQNTLYMKIANADFENQEIENNFNSVLNGLIEEIKQKDLIKTIRLKRSMSPSVRVSY